MDITTFYLTCYCITFILTIIALVQIKSFTGAHAQIGSEEQIELFKALARSQMYFALGAISIYGIGGLAAFYGLVMGEISLLLFLFMNAIFFGLSKLFKAAENRAHMMPVDDEFKEEYRFVCNAWLTKALPNF